MVTAPQTTRRALIATAAALPVLAGVTVLKDEREVPHPTSRDWIEQIATLHPNGRRAALQAYRVDVDWDRIKGIELGGPNAPVLRFATRDGGASEVVVTPHGAWLHGPIDLRGELA